MNILIIGSGGREHALAWKMLQSPLCSKLFVAPGNAGTHAIATNVNIHPTDFNTLAEFCVAQDMNLIVVGPELPLVLGITDFFQSKSHLQHIQVIGPGRQGAQLEGSKDFSKAFMIRNGILTARSVTFTKETIQNGFEYLQSQNFPIVLKADGLASGKGVIIAENLKVAMSTLHDMLELDKFGEAGAKVVIEEYLSGIELSAFVLTDGTSYVRLPDAKDYKRIGIGDTGLNTGGMGAVSPVPFVSSELQKSIEEKIIKPTIAGLTKENIDYRGFIFFGIMNVSGTPYLIEYNARLGDPETEAILPRLNNDLVVLFLAASENKLNEVKLSFKEDTAATIMMVAGGYPEDYSKEDVITGMHEAKDVLTFHAGTKILNNNIVTNGGRVVAITAMAENLTAALEKANSAAATIHWNNCYFRNDIGADLIKFTAEPIDSASISRQQN